MVSRAFMWAVQGILVLLIYYLVDGELTGVSSNETQRAVSVGLMVGATALVMGILGGWVLSIAEEYRKVRSAEESPVSGALHRYAATLSGSFIVMYAASSASGRDLQKDLHDYVARTKSLRNRWGRCAKPGDLPAPCDTGGLDACSPPKDVLEVLQAYCAPQLARLAGSMLEFQRSGGTRSLERNLLWKSIDYGVSRVRLLATADQEMRLLTQESLRDLVLAELVPPLQLRGAELAGTFVPLQGSMATATSLGMARSSIGSSGGSGGDPAASCFGACLGNPDVKLAYFDGGSTCYTSSTVDALRGFVYAGPGAAAAAAAGAPRMMVARPVDGELESGSATGVCGLRSAATSRQLIQSSASSPPLPLPEGVADYSGAFSFAPGERAADSAASSARLAKPGDLVCVSETQAQLYEAAARQGGVATAMLRTATPIAQQLVRVIRRYPRGSISLDRVRVMIDAHLSGFYGEALYDQSVSSAVDVVMRRVRELDADARQPQKWVDPDVLLGKVSAMDPTTLYDTRQALGDMADAADAHVRTFPAYRSGLTGRLCSLVLLFSGVIMLVLFAVYLTVQVQQTTLKKAFGVPGMLQRLLVALCGLIVALFCIETVSKKIGSDVSHDQSRIDFNGVQLATGCRKLSDAFGRLVKSVGSSDSAAAQAAAAAFLADAAEVDAAYTRCNPVNSGRATMPMPTTELVLYGVIGALFLGAALLCMRRLRTLESFSTLRELLSLRHRLLSGDRSAVAASRMFMVCATDGGHDNLATVAVWLGVLLLCTLTLWFMVKSVFSPIEYQLSLGAIDDCTGSTEAEANT
jgi:hypothetical protein